MGTVIAVCADDEQRAVSAMMARDGALLLVFVWLLMIAGSGDTLLLRVTSYGKYMYVLHAIFTRTRHRTVHKNGGQPDNNRRFGGGQAFVGGKERRYSCTCTLRRTS